MICKYEFEASNLISVVNNVAVVVLGKNKFKNIKLHNIQYNCFQGTHIVLK